MRTLESVKKALTSRYRSLSYFDRLDNCISAALAELWNSEEVIAAVAGRTPDAPAHLRKGTERVFPYVILITDKARTVQTFEFKTVTYGTIFSHTDYRFESDVHDLSWADPDKTRCVKRTFSNGNVLYDVVFDATFPVKFIMEVEQDAIAIRDAVLGAVKKMDEKKAAEKAKSAPAAAPKQAADPVAAVREIRKMYEDGLIGKDEMMELLRAALK